MKNVAIVALCITLIIIRNFVAKKTIFENVENMSFKIKKIIDVDEKKIRKIKKKIVFNSNAQQLRRNKIKTIYKNENQYNFFLKILKLKLMKMQKKN